VFYNPVIPAEAQLRAGTHEHGRASIGRLVFMGSGFTPMACPGMTIERKSWQPNSPAPARSSSTTRRSSCRRWDAAADALERCGFRLTRFTVQTNREGGATVPSGTGQSLRDAETLSRSADRDA